MLIKSSSASAAQPEEESGAAAGWPVLKGPARALGQAQAGRAPIWPTPVSPTPRKESPGGAPSADVLAVRPLTRVVRFRLLSSSFLFARGCSYGRLRRLRTYASTNIPDQLLERAAP